jgi:hypothetical protein
MDLVVNLVSQLPDVVSLHKVPGQNQPLELSFTEMQKKQPEKLAELKATDFDAFADLYEKEYGKKPKQ